MNNNSTTKQNLMDAFWVLYKAKGLNKVSIKEVAQKAGYNRSTFYEYFSSTYEVLDCIESSLIASIDDLPPISLSSGTFGKSPELFFALFEKEAEYYSVLLGEHGDYRFQCRLKNKVKDLIRAELCKLDDAESRRLDYMLEYSISGLIGIMCHYLNDRNSLSRPELYGLLHSLMQEGLMKLLPAN